MRSWQGLAAECSHLASGQAALHQSDRTPRRRDQAAHRGRRHLPRRDRPSGVSSEHILLEQNDEWAVQRARYMTLETIAPALRSAIAPSSQPSYPPPPATACPPSRHCCTRIPEQDAVTRPFRRALRAAPDPAPLSRIQMLKENFGFFSGRDPDVTQKADAAVAGN
jgi:hypothetical protein